MCKNKPNPQRLQCIQHSFRRSVTFTAFATANTVNMDIQTLLNNLHEEVSCSVCMSKYTDPKQLPCLHSFCLHCLNGIQRTSGRRDKIPCPECRQEFKIPDNGNLAALPTNFRINSLLDVLAIKECNTTGVKCGNCDKRSKESHYCFQCCAFWCGECITFHNGMKANKDHYALALEDFQDHDFENILKRPTFCAIQGHEKKEIEFFCNICEVAICNACALTNHDGHGKILLEQTANERKLRIKSAIESQRKRAQTKRSKITKLDESLSEVQEQAARVKRNIEEFADRQVQNAGHRSQVRLQGTGHRSQVTGHRAQVTGHRLQGTGHRAQSTGHRAQGTGHRSQVTGHRLQGTGHRS